MEEGVEEGVDGTIQSLPLSSSVILCIGGCGNLQLSPLEQPGNRPVWCWLASGLEPQEILLYFVVQEAINLWKFTYTVDGALVCDGGRWWWKIRTNNPFQRTASQNYRQLFFNRPSFRPERVQSGP